MRRTVLLGGLVALLFLAAPAAAKDKKKTSKDAAPPEASKQLRDELLKVFDEATEPEVVLMTLGVLTELEDPAKLLPMALRKFDKLRMFADAPGRDELKQQAKELIGMIGEELARSKTFAGRAKKAVTSGMTLPSAKYLEHPPQYYPPPAQPTTTPPVGPPTRPGYPAVPSTLPAPPVSPVPPASPAPPPAY